MAIAVFPAPSVAAKSRFTTTLLSGTSWTVPAGVTLINVRRAGGTGGSYVAGTGGGEAGGSTTFTGLQDAPGGNPGLNVGSYGNDGHTPRVIEDSLAATPGASIAYSIGIGGFSGGSSAYGRAQGGYITIEYWL
jgi:hypothetical protein